MILNFFEVTLRSEINAMPKLTRLKLTRDLINANRENIRFWSVLINANFQSQNKIFDLIKKVRTLLLANKKIHDTEHFDRHQRENTIYGHCTFIVIDANTANLKLIY